MKAGITTSVILHAAILGFAFVSLSSPPAFDVQDVEALPIDIVPLEEFSQVQEGEKTAAVTNTPAPKPTAKEDIVPEAEKIGENEKDLETPPVPEEKPREVKTAEAPPPAPKPALEPEPKPEPKAEPKPEPKPEPVPVPEVAPEPQPKQEVTGQAKVEEPKPEPKPEPKAEPKPEVAEKAEPVEDKIAEAIADAPPETEVAALPDSGPVIEARPKPPAQQAKTPERKEPEDKPETKKASAQSGDSKSVEDEVAALLNKEKASGGGAKRSKKEAALGGKKTTGGKLSQGEMDALRNQLSGCWSLPIGMEGDDSLRVKVRFNVDPSGKVEGRPQVEDSSGNRQFDESAVRAVQKCNNRGLVLPSGKHDIWNEVVVNFDPSDMF